MLPDDDGRAPLFLKRHRLASGRHRIRERFKRSLGASPALREWRNAIALHGLGLPVAMPLALAELPDGDALIVQRAVPGVPLRAWLDAHPTKRRPLLESLGGAIRALHVAGAAHGDLHADNVLVIWEESAREPAVVLVDLGRARAHGASKRAQLRDLGQLGSSLDRAGVSRADRARLAAIALGLPAHSPTTRALRKRALTRVRNAEHRYAGRHARNRTRRAMRSGPEQPAFRGVEGRGLRVADLPGATLAQALTHHRALLESDAAAGSEAVLKDDGRTRVTRHDEGGRPLVVKEHRPRGLSRRLADGLRGSPARRGWRVAHGLRVRGIEAARPLAFVERRRALLPESSLLVLELVGEGHANDPPSPPAGISAEEAERALADALVDLTLRLHRGRVRHGDLKANNIRVWWQDGRMKAALIDLESARFDRPLSEGERLEDLAQLWASIPGARLSAATRHAMLERYQRALPFGTDLETVAARLHSRSVQRRHRWPLDYAPRPTVNH